MFPFPTVLDCLFATRPDTLRRTNVARPVNLLRSRDSGRWLLLSLLSPPSISGELKSLPNLMPPNPRLDQIHLPSMNPYIAGEVTEFRQVVVNLVRRCLHLTLLHQSKYPSEKVLLLQQ